MTFKDRKYKRIDSLNLISYNALDKKGDVLAQGMGRTLNVSQGGILIETHTPIDARFVILMSIGFKEKVIDIKGKVVYTREGKEDKYESGIEFSNIDEVTLQALNKYIEAFQKLKVPGKAD